jgi:hypothetical protein
VPWLLGRDGNRVTFAPHPDVDTLRTGVRADPGPAVLSAGSPVTVPVGRHADVVLRASLGEAPLGLTLEGSGGRLLAVTAEPADAAVRVVSAAGQADVRLPMRAASDGRIDLRLLVDAGVVEVFCEGGVAVARVPTRGGDASLAVEGDGVRLGRLLVHEMERLTG